MDKLSKVTKAVNEAWHRGNADIVCSTALQWALVYNTMMVKVIPIKDGNISYHALEPHCFGVLREDVPYVDRQEAMYQEYYITKSELESLLAANPMKDKILQQVSGTQVSSVSDSPNAVSRIVMAASSPNMIGNASTMQTGQSYLPQVAEPLIQMYELWLWNDEINDYQTVTMAEPGVTIYDRKNIFVEGEVPFVQICPNPLYNYF